MRTRLFAEGKSDAQRCRKLDRHGRLIEEYETIHIAAIANGLSYEHLQKCLSDGHRCCGMRFEYCVTLNTGREAPKGFHATHNPYEIYREKTAIAR